MGISKNIFIKNINAEHANHEVSEGIPLGDAVGRIRRVRTKGVPLAQSVIEFLEPPNS